MKYRPILFSSEMVRALLAGRKTQTRRMLRDQNPIDLGAGIYGAHLSRREVHDHGKLVGHRMAPVNCPYGVPRDRLWVRENGWEPHEPSVRERRDGADTWPKYAYDAEGWTDIDFEQFKAWGWKRRPSIHMPRWASRITLEMTGVRVERLQDISEADAVAEGCEAKPFPGPWWQGYRDMGDGELIHQQSIGESPPDWMIEPKRMKDTPHLNRSAIDAYRGLWGQINGAESWDANPYVWIVEFKALVAALLERTLVQ